MTGLSALLLPILLSAVIVFVMSFVIHMLTPWHKGDFSTLPNEDQVRNAIRALGIPPGEYATPKPTSAQDMKSPEFKEKMRQGPVLLLTVYPNGPMSMGQSLTLWFLYSLVIGVFAGYVTGRALPYGAAYLQVFRFAGVTAFLGYAVALWQMSIWYKRSWVTTFKNTVDGLVYALLTAGTFGWLWPK